VGGMSRSDKNVQVQVWTSGFLNPDDNDTMSTLYLTTLQLAKTNSIT
jgi:hypothetical protein